MIRHALTLALLTTPVTATAACYLSPVGTSWYTYTPLTNAQLVNINFPPEQSVDLYFTTGYSDSVVWVGPSRGSLDVGLSYDYSYNRETNTTMSPGRILHDKLMLDGSSQAFRSGSYKNVSFDRSYEWANVRNLDYWRFPKLLGLTGTVAGSANVWGTIRGVNNIPSNKCEALSRLGASLYLRNTGTQHAYIRGSMTNHYSNNFGVNTIYDTEVRLVMPLRVEITPSSLSFGQITTGNTGVEQFTSTVHAAALTPHTITFTYSSDGGTREVLTIDGNPLPYTASRTIPAGQSSRSEKWTARINSSTAAVVKGRLQITARII